MKILILEDDDAKKDSVISLISEIDSEITIESVNNFCDYLKAITQDSFDLIIVDLVILAFSNEIEPQDMTERIIEVTRDFDCLNFRTPVVALTGFDDKAEENFKDLNSKDISVITFDGQSEQWKISIGDKVKSCIPPVHYDFVIICALPKEANAFSDAGYKVGEIKPYKNLSCRQIEIGAKRGVIVTAPRMGLVSSAITSTQAIDLFKPKLICMSGICGGADGEANIYDVVIPEICHQHDSGKWTNNGFEPELFSIPLDHGLRLKIEALISKSEFKTLIKKNVILQRNEFPKGTDSLEFDIFFAPTSSGSAVVADKENVALITGQKRKLSAFEMESFAIYEAARLSPIKPHFFSAKAVVDNGILKGDKFHRVACILSAKVVYECINSGLIDS